jgi:hypothetical protein
MEMRKLILTSAAAAIGGLTLAATAAVAQPYPYDEPGYYPHHDYSYGYDRYLDDGYAAPRGEVPVDRFGPDPNGMIARDGHVIKCKLRDRFDDYLDHYVTRRVCD